MNLSIVISLFNEEESLNELIKGIKDSIENSEIKGIEYEIIMINDGSTDNSWNTIKGLSKNYSFIKAVCFRRNYGKSAALYIGFKKAEGDVVITMDADLQDDPNEIAPLYKMIIEDDYDIVSGWKQKRRDNKLTKNLPSKIYNYTARKVTGIKLHDMNCGIKAYKKIVVKNIEVYGEMHRYIPYLAKNAGFTNITEKKVFHHKRKYGKSKFGINRFINGFLDLLSLNFLAKFGKKPMHLFGTLGILSFLSGFVIAIWILADKLVAQSHGLKFRPATEQPLFYIALVVVIIGTLLFLTGFIGELISRNSNSRNEYKIREEI